MRVPPALCLAPGWSSTAAADAVRLWSELSEGHTGPPDVAAAAARARLTPEGLTEALGLLLKAGLVEEESDGYALRTPPPPPAPEV